MTSEPTDLERDDRRPGDLDAGQSIEERNRGGFSDGTWILPVALGALAVIGVTFAWIGSS